MSINLSRHNMAQIQKRVDHLEEVYSGLQGEHAEVVAMALNVTIEGVKADLENAYNELELATNEYNSVLERAKKKADFSKNNHVVSRKLIWSK